MPESGPIPSQLVKESRTEPIAGSQTSHRTMRVGTMTISDTTTLSRVDSWSIPLYLRLLAMAARLPSGTEDALLLGLDAREETVDVLGVLDEALDRRDHHRRGEVGARVAVHELRDRLGRLDVLQRLLLQGRVAARVSRLVGGDDARVGLEREQLRLGLGDVLEQLLGAALVLRLGAHHVAVDRRLDGVGADRRVDLGEAEEVEVVLLGALGELLGEERAEDVHARLLLLERLCRLLPGAAERVRLVQREDAGPRVEDLLDLRVGPVLLARHQADVEVVAVDAQVDLVERAHGGPAVLVAEGDRVEAVLLHLRAERVELVEGLGDLVALVLEDALAVEDRPRVVGDRHEVLLAVGTGRR